MLKYKLLVLLVFSFGYSWAQVHPVTHQHLLEVLQYEESLKDSYPVYLGITEGLEEAAPLHYYQASSDGLARLSTYYFSKQDSLVTSAQHQWGRFDALFQPKLSFDKKSIKSLRDNYLHLQEELVGVYGSDNKVFTNTNPKSKVRNEIIKWQVPILYDPTLEYREMEQQGQIYGITSLSYANLGWEELVIDQLGFLQYYFLSNIQADKYKLAKSLLDADLKTAIQDEHFKDISNMLNSHKIELYNSREGFAGVEREYLFMYRLLDAEGVIKYTLNLAFNNKQDISFLQYRPIQ